MLVILHRLRRLYLGMDMYVCNNNQWKKRRHEFERARKVLWEGLEGGKGKEKLCNYNLKGIKDKGRERENRKKNT